MPRKPVTERVATSLIALLAGYDFLLLSPSSIFQLNLPELHA